MDSAKEQSVWSRSIKFGLHCALQRLWPCTAAFFQKHNVPTQCSLLSGLRSSLKMWWMMSGHSDLLWMIPLYLITYQEGNRMHLIKSGQWVPCPTPLVSVIGGFLKQLKQCYPLRDLGWKRLPQCSCSRVISRMRMSPSGLGSESLMERHSILCCQQTGIRPDFSHQFSETQTLC